ncbi:MAG: PCRF domain-containing protein [Hyphomonadaceae bacterium]
MTALSERPDFWNESEKAQKLMRERNKLDAAMGAITSLERDLRDALELAEMAEAEGDGALVDEAFASLQQAQTRAAQAELEALLSGEADGNDAYVEFNPAARGHREPGLDRRCSCACTRAGRMRGFKVEFLEEQGGDTAGIKSATIWCREKMPTGG